MTIRIGLSILSDARTGFQLIFSFSPIAQSRSLAGEPTDARDRRNVQSRDASRNHFRAFALALAALLALPPLALAAFVMCQPYYVFGSPNWRGFNDVRPYYEPHVLVAKPYQVRRQQPSAVGLGSSRVEVGIDPRHGGWTDTNVFNFALPSRDSYAVMLASCMRRRWVPHSASGRRSRLLAYNINHWLQICPSNDLLTGSPRVRDISEGKTSHPTEAPTRCAKCSRFTAPETWNGASISPSTRT